MKTQGENSRGEAKGGQQQVLPRAWKEQPCPRPGLGPPPPGLGQRERVSARICCSAARACAWRAVGAARDQGPARVPAWWRMK